MADTLTVKYYARALQWSSSSTIRHTSGATASSGDLLLFILMSSGNKQIPLPSGWKWVDPPENKGSSSVSMAYKKITNNDKNTTLTIDETVNGGATYVHLSSCNVISEGLAPNGSSITHKLKGENFVIQTNQGDYRDSGLLSNGFSYLAGQAVHYQNGYTVLSKKFIDSITYTSSGDSGWNQRPSYLVLSVGPVKETNLEVSYSVDGVLYSAYAPYDASKPPQARFLKFKAKMSGGQSNGEVSTFEFDQSKPETKVALGKFLESVSTNLVPKKTYTKDMEQDTSYSEEDARLFKSSWTKSEFKKMLAMQIK